MVYPGFWSLATTFGNSPRTVALSRAAGPGVSDNCFTADSLRVCRTGYAPNPWEAVVRNDDDEHVKSGGRRRRATPWVETEKERMKVSCLRLVEAHCLLLSVLVHGTVVGCVHL